LKYTSVTLLVLRKFHWRYHTANSYTVPQHDDDEKTQSVAPWV